MTFDGLMDTIKQVYLRAAPGPLRDRGWGVISERAGRDLQSLVRRDANLRRIDYCFNVIVDSDGRESFNPRSMQAAQQSWMDGLLGAAAPGPSDSLEIRGRILRRGSTARATVEISTVRRTPSSLTLGRGGTSTARPRVREEGSRATVRGGVIDADALARLSGGVRSTSGSRTATANLTDEEAGRDSEP
jgi:hypothetical protein